MRHHQRRRVSALVVRGGDWDRGRAREICVFVCREQNIQPHSALCNLCCYTSYVARSISGGCGRDGMDWSAPDTFRQLESMSFEELNNANESDATFDKLFDSLEVRGS